MDWKTCAVDDLRRYNHMKIGILNSKDKLNAIESAAKRARTSAAKTMPHTDSRIVDAIVESERLKNNIKTAERLTSLIDRGLSSLSDEERRVLEWFYMKDVPQSMSQLKNELGYETRSLYRLRDRALQKFTLAMYGVEVL